MLDGKGDVLMDVYGAGYSAKWMVPSRVIKPRDVVSGVEHGLLHEDDAAAFVSPLAATSSSIAKAGTGPFTDSKRSSVRLPFDTVTIAKTCIRAKHSRNAPCHRMPIPCIQFVQDETIPVDVRLAFSMLPTTAGVPFDDGAWTFALESVQHSMACAASIPHTPVGMIGSSSIGQLISQLTLNSFHNAGVYEGTVTQGLPRFNFLISASKSGKGAGMDVILKDCDTPQAGVSALNFVNRLRHLKVADVVKSVRVEMEAVPELTPATVRQKGALPWLDDAFRNTEDTVTHVIVITLDKVSTIQHGSSVRDVANKIRSECAGMDDAGIKVTHSTLNASDWVIHIVPNRKSDRDHLRHCEVMAGELMSTRVSGIPGIEHGSVQMNADGQRFVRFVGSNLETVLSLPEVQYATTTDVAEMYSVFGIEGARECLMEQLNVAVSSASFTDPRHISVITAYMTRNGYLTGTSRHGFKRASMSALRRMAFETFIDSSFTAATSSEFSSTRVSSITENMCAARRPLIGSGAVVVVPKQVDGVNVGATKKVKRPTMLIHADDGLTHYVGVRQSKSKMRRVEWAWSPQEDLEKQLDACLHKQSLTGGLRIDTSGTGSTVYSNGPPYDDYGAPHDDYGAPYDDYGAPYDDYGYAPVSPTDAGAAASLYAPLSPVASAMAVDTSTASAADNSGYAPMSPVGGPVGHEDVYSPTSPVGK